MVTNGHLGLTHMGRQLLYLVMAAQFLGASQTVGVTKEYKCVNVSPTDYIKNSWCNIITLVSYARTPRSPVLRSNNLATTPHHEAQPTFLCKNSGHIENVITFVRVTIILKELNTGQHPWWVMGVSCQ